MQLERDSARLAERGRLPRRHFPLNLLSQILQKELSLQVVSKNLLQ